ncbi:hypothetical protein EQG49_04945 [Periweissella cryptocerci]|uniref:Uncharacterized protein n=1 Tax=Periweissella cryptocerci TaxID=2506420 RepID=A0A4P6YT85_9LACO|nr:hypothetical protein [Periweissella cryptocerci]QBO35857.1 hypothetical protein EQG49_04945 [Periweissella cryptocerci]
MAEHTHDVTELIEDLQADLAELGDEQVYAVYGQDDHAELILDYIAVNPIAGVTTDEQMAEILPTLAPEERAMVKQHGEMLADAVANETTKAMLASELVALLIEQNK